MALLLKVLSGPHQGAEFDVPDEEIVIGAADECDVIVGDALVANKHVKFKISEGRIFVTPLEGNVFIEGKLLREPSLVDNFKFVTIGATHMMIGDATDEKWKDVELGRFPELEKVAEEVTTFAEAEDDASLETEADEANVSGDGKRKGSEGNIDEKTLNDRKIAVADGIGSSAKIKRTWKERVGRMTMGFVICFAIALAASIGAVLTKNSQLDNKPEVKPEAIDIRIQKAVDALKLRSKIKVSKVGDSDTISVVGYVDTMKDSATVKATVQAISESASVKIQNTEKILSSATELIQQSKQNVLLKASEEFGEIIATGYIKKPGIWENLRNEIRSVSGVINVRDEVLTKESASALAKSTLEKYALQDKLEIKTNDAGVEITGTISDKDKDKDIWGKAKEDLVSEFKKKAQLSFQIGVSTDRNLTIEKFFGGKIDSVNFNNQGLDWVNIKNGNKYFQGSVLPSGYIIDRIEQDSVTIKNADEVIQLDFDWI